jgi:protein-L-isoaspartate(D-aspartate) O-methyltransferase
MFFMHPAKRVLLSSFCWNIVLNILFVNFQRFWSGSSINKNKAMVEHLQHYGVISSKKVSEVMETIDRALFVPDGTPAYVDSPMAIGYNATISAPHMHATCLQLLEENLKPGMHALDVGSGAFPFHPSYLH